MKIAPQPPPPAALPGQLPAAAAPARPFEDFLDEAFGFAELGMFGHGGAKAPEPGPGTCRGPAPEQPAAAPDPPPEPGEETAEPAMIPHARALSRQPAAAPAEAHRIGRNIASARAKPQVPAGELPAPEPAPEGPDQEAAAPARRGARRLPPPPRSDVSLIVTEQAGRVELIAAAPKLDPEARAALRRLVRDILARSGLSLSHFQLNGAPVAADSLDTPGGFHGTRSR